MRVITTYVLRSEADALNFKDDLAADLKEFWEALKDSSKIMHKKLVADLRVFAGSQSGALRSALLHEASAMEQRGPDLTGLVEEMETYRKLMEDFGIDPKRRPSQEAR